MIRYECEHCQTVVETPASRAGKTENCPNCGSVCVVPRRGSYLSAVLAFCVLGAALAFLLFAATRRSRTETRRVEGARVDGPPSHVDEPVKKEAQHQEAPVASADEATSAGVPEAAPEPRAPLNVQPGDEVIVRHGPAPVKVGEKTLATLEVGTVLPALAVRGDWVKVRVERDGKSIAGWISGPQHLDVALKAPTSTAPPPIPEAEPRDTDDRDDFVIGGAGPLRWASAKTLRRGEHSAIQFTLSEESDWTAIRDVDLVAPVALYLRGAKRGEASDAAARDPKLFDFTITITDIVGGDAMVGEAEDGGVTIQELYDGVEDRTVPFLLFGKNLEVATGGVRRTGAAFLGLCLDTTGPPSKQNRVVLFRLSAIKKCVTESLRTFRLEGEGRLVLVLLAAKGESKMDPVSNRIEVPIKWE